MPKNSTKPSGIHVRKFNNTAWGCNLKQ